MALLFLLAARCALSSIEGHSPQTPPVSFGSKHICHKVAEREGYHANPYIISTSGGQKGRIKAISLLIGHLRSLNTQN